MTQTDRDTPVTALRRLVAALDARGLEGPDWTTGDVERRWAEMDAELVAATDNARAALASSDDVAGSGEPRCSCDRCRSHDERAGMRASADDVAGSRVVREEVPGILVDRASDDVAGSGERLNERLLRERLPRAINFRFLPPRPTNDPIWNEVVADLVAPTTEAPPSTDAEFVAHQRRDGTIVPVLTKEGRATFPTTEAPPRDAPPYHNGHWCPVCVPRPWPIEDPA